MSNTADAFPSMTCYTNSMKDCNREPCGSHRPAGLFLCREGGADDCQGNQNSPVPTPAVRT